MLQKPNCTSPMVVRFRCFKCCVLMEVFHRWGRFWFSLSWRSFIKVSCERMHFKIIYLCKWCSTLLAIEQLLFLFFFSSSGCCIVWWWVHKGICSIWWWTRNYRIFFWAHSLMLEFRSLLDVLFAIRAHLSKISTFAFMLCSLCKLQFHVTIHALYYS